MSLTRELENIAKVILGVFLISLFLLMAVLILGAWLL